MVTRYPWRSVEETMNSLPPLVWTEVSDIRKPVSDAIRLIGDSLRQANLPASRYQADDAAQAIVVPSSSLSGLGGSTKPALPEDLSEFLFLAPGKYKSALTRLPGDHHTPIGLAWPDSPRADDEVSAVLGASVRATAVGAWSLPCDAGKPYEFRLYRLTPIHAALQKLLDSPARKLGERADNLEGRSRWFQKRQGEGK
jgi:hypothetical protein